MALPVRRKVKKIYHKGTPVARPSKTTQQFIPVKVNQGHLELTTTDGSNPIIGFHRGGYTAVALYHKSDADKERLNIMRHDGTDYYLWDSGLLRVNNGSLEYNDNGRWKPVGISATANKISVGQNNATATSYVTAHSYNGSGYLTLVEQFISGSYRGNGCVKVVIDGIVVLMESIIW